MPMPPLKIKPHLTYEEITKRYRECKKGREKSYWHLIWIMANPKRELLVTEAAKTVGFCQRWARTLSIDSMKTDQKILLIKEEIMRDESLF